MKGLKKLANETLSGKRIPLYYSIKDDTVSSENKEGYYLLTYLINKNSEKSIQNTVKKYMSM